MCGEGVVTAMLCTTATVQDYVVHHRVAFFWLEEMQIVPKKCLVRPIFERETSCLNCNRYDNVIKLLYGMISIKMCINQMLRYM